MSPQVVNILGRGEEGWWKGELEVKEGVLPDNFVQLIPLYKPSSMNECHIAENLQFTPLQIQSELVLHQPPTTTTALFVY